MPFLSSMGTSTYTHMPTHRHTDRHRTKSKIHSFKNQYYTELVQLLFCYYQRTPWPKVTVGIECVWLTVSEGWGPSWQGGVTASSRYGVRSGKLREHIFNHKYYTKQRVNSSEVKDKAIRPQSWFQRCLPSSKRVPPNFPQTMPPTRNQGFKYGRHSSFKLRKCKHSI